MRKFSEKLCQYESRGSAGPLPGLPGPHARAIGSARRYIKGFDKHDFLNDTKTQDAVILKLLVIGEAAAKIAGEYPDFVEQHPELPWKEMRGMRNRMVHGYFDINLQIVWDTLNDSLPDLETKVGHITASASTEGEGRARGET